MGRQKVLIVGGGTLQVPVVREAKALGLEVLVIDRNPNCECAEIADNFEVCDIYNPQHATHVAQQHRIDGVAAIAIDAEDTAAYVARELDLPGPPLVASRITRNKRDFYTVMGKSLLREHVPRSVVIQTRLCFSRQAHTDSIDFEPPWIVRPLTQAGSRGVSIVREPKELPQTLLRAEPYGPSAQISELLPPGYEHSTEIMFLEGEPTYLNSVLRPFLARDFLGGTAVEIGHISPAPHIPTELPPTHLQLGDLAIGVAGELGVNWGVVKIDTLTPYGTDKPYLLEATLRLSGGCDSTNSYPLAFGKSSVRGFLKLAMGESVEKDEVVGPRQQFAAVSGYWLPQCMVERVATPERIAQDLGVHEVVLRARPGWWDPGPDCAGRAGFVIATGESGQEAWANAVSAALAVPAYYKVRS